MTPWDTIAGHARKQDGAVDRAQLLAAGLQEDQITRACRDGRLQRAYRGAYLVGSAPPSRHGAIWAAYLASGPDVFVDHVTALELLRMHEAEGDTIHLACATRRRSRGMVRLHEAPKVAPRHLWNKRGMRVAAPPLALLHAAPDLASAVLQVTLANAIAKRLTTLARIDDVLAAHPRHPGTVRLREATFAERDDPGEGATIEALEARFLVLLRALPDVPPFVRNERLELPDGTNVVPDLWFPGPRVWLELDSRSWHGRREAMDADRRKDQRAAAFGITIFRITWNQLEHEWDAVAADLLRVLRR